MSNIKFISHEAFPEDQYHKELVYLEIEDKFRVAYVRKQAKTGGLFWSVPSVAISKDGAKAYYEVFMQDSTFLEKDIKHFLDSRPWESKKSQPAARQIDEELPF